MSDMDHHDAIPSKLYYEHLVLGAEFGDDGRVQQYDPSEAENAIAAQQEGTVLAEISHHYLLLASGGAAQQFAEAACAGQKLAIGTCAFEAVLTGDGSLVSVPLVARTGDAEYLFLDISRRADVLDAWLSFLCAIEQDGVSPFKGVQCDEVATTHVACMLWGKRAAEVLSDYLRDEGRLPRVGEVHACKLDDIPCIVMRPKVKYDDCFLLLVPPHKSVILWRSMLSFPFVTPVGRKSIDKLLRQDTRWWELVTQEGVVRASGKLLKDLELIRPLSDYVGARGLMGADGAVDNGRG